MKNHWLLYCSLFSAYKILQGDDLKKILKDIPFSEGGCTMVDLHVDASADFSAAVRVDLADVRVSVTPVLYPSP